MHLNAVGEITTVTTEVIAAATTGAALAQDQTALLTARSKKNKTEKATSLETMRTGLLRGEDVGKFALYS